MNGEDAQNRPPVAKAGSHFAELRSVSELVYPERAEGPRLKPPESQPFFMGLKAHAPSVSRSHVASVSQVRDTASQNLL